MFGFLLFLVRNRTVTSFKCDQMTQTRPWELPHLLTEALGFVLVEDAYDDHDRHHHGPWPREATFSVLPSRQTARCP